MKLAQIMNQPVLSIEPDVTLSDAIRVMEESGRGFLPVVQDGSVVGVVTGRDIVTKGIGHGMNPDESRVVNVMTAPARTVSCDLEAEDAAILMRRRPSRTAIRRPSRNLRNPLETNSRSLHRLTADSSPESEIENVYLGQTRIRSEVR